MNEKITSPEVRLVDSESEVLGVFSTHEAIKKASELGLDLVEVSPNATPPVCKMMDFGKYRYDNKKKHQQSKKKQKTADVKEIRFRPNIGQHDLQVKINQITKFLKNKEKVKLTLRFRGREIAHHNIGMEIINTAIQAVSEISQVESPPKIEGKQIIALLVAK